MAILFLAFATGACGDDTTAVQVALTPESTKSQSAGPLTPVTARRHKHPYVYLLGGSAARECIVSNASWTDEIRMLGGGKVRAYDLGDRLQSFDVDAELVEAMPDGPTLVLIGLSIGRFTMSPEESRVRADEQDAGQIVASPPEPLHQYDASGIHSDAKKTRILDRWVVARYPVFLQHYAYNVAGLERLIKACRRRDFEAVLLELPYNSYFPGTAEAFGGPRRTYSAEARKLAGRFRIPYVDFLSELALSNEDFTDFQHVAESGRSVTQRRFSREVVTLLETRRLR